MKKGWLAEIILISMYQSYMIVTRALRAEYIDSIKQMLGCILILYIEKLMAETVRRKMHEEYQHPIFFDIDWKLDIIASGITIAKVAVIFIVQTIVHVINAWYGEAYAIWQYNLFAEKGYMFFYIVYFSGWIVSVAVLLMFYFKMNKIYHSVYPKQNTIQ